MCFIDGQENKYSVLNECSRMLKYNRPRRRLSTFISNYSGVIYETDGDILVNVVVQRRQTRRLRVAEQGTIFGSEANYKMLRNLCR
jgi:hypothetical protein